MTGAPRPRPVDHAVGAAEVARALREGRTTCAASVEAALAAIGRANEVQRAFVTVVAERARREAEAQDRARGAGAPAGALEGVVVGVKDVIHAAGMRTGAGSRVFEGRPPEVEDADCVAALRRHGAIVIGKTHTHEFALGGTGRNAWAGDAHNPHDPGRMAGGSSSGSAIAVATGMAHVALGTDAGGSVRGPAAMCGVVGFKHTYGRASLAGALPSGWSVDSLGVLAPRIADVELVLPFLVQDPAPAPTDDPPPLRIGVPGRYFADLLAGDVRTVWDSVKVRVGEIEAVMVRLPEWPDPQLVGAADAVSWTLNSAEAAAFHEPWLETDADAYGADVRERLELGRCITATEYLRAQRLRRYVQDRLEPVWDRVDVLLTPACPVVAPPLDAEELAMEGGARLPLAVLNRLFRIANLMGWPAVTIPAGRGEGGMPVGVQLMAAGGHDERLLEVAGRLEAVLA